MSDARKYVTPALIVILGLLLFYNNHSGSLARQERNCDAINEVKAQLVSYIDQQIARSSKSLPTVDYYRRHPVELGKALASLERQRSATHEAFAPTSC